MNNPKGLVVTLEDDETLHDLWANLLVTALDPSCPMPRSAFIGIIRQLEPVDVQILNFLYNNYLELQEKEKKEFNQPQKDKIQSEPEALKETVNVNNHVVDITITVFMLPTNATNYPCVSRDIVNGLNIKLDTYLISIDNLIRQQLVTSYSEMIKEDLIDSKDAMRWEGTKESIKIYKNWGYLKVSITELGVSFVKACTITD